MDDEGMHALTVEVSGMSVSRRIDAAAFFIGCLATLSQLLYVVAIKLWPPAAPDDVGLQAQVVFGVVLLINISATLYLLDYEIADNNDFNLWLRKWERRMLFVLAAPLTIELMPFVSSRTFGLTAPLRAATRDAVIKWSALMLVLQDGVFLWLLLLGSGEGLLRNDPVEDTDVS